MNIYLKKLLIIPVIALSATAFAQESVITKEQLPTEINSYLSTHFGAETVAQATMEKKSSKTEYEIYLKNGTKLEFNNLMLHKVDGREKLPNSVVPQVIQDYVSKNYSSYYITEWKMKKTKQKVELNNGLELEFTKAGVFMGIDD